MKQHLKNLLLRLADRINAAYRPEPKPSAFGGAPLSHPSQHPNAPVGDPRSPIVSDPLHDELLTPDKVPLSRTEAERKMEELRDSLADLIDDKLKRE